MLKPAITIMVVCLLASPLAYADSIQHRDMFGDIYDRPPVADDPSPDADFFATHQDYVRSNKDMFDHTHMEPGVNDMFHANVGAQPDKSIFNWPTPSQR